METNLSTKDNGENFQVDALMEEKAHEYMTKCSYTYGDLEERIRWHRNVKEATFINMIRASASCVMRQRGTYTPYVIDGQNRDIIEQLYYYFIGDRDKCRWNVDKGIYLHGKIGCGKTLLMAAFLDVVHGMCNIITKTIHAKKIHEVIKADGIERLVPCPLFIDELGRESLEINEFGNKIRPIQDLIAMRYESGARTFCSSNFSTEQLEGKVVDGVLRGYGKYVRTRMEEMMNIVRMPGENRRPQYVIDHGKAD